MNMSTRTGEYSKSTITQFLVEAMKDDPEIREIIVFGSFLRSENPGDIDEDAPQNSFMQEIRKGEVIYER